MTAGRWIASTALVAAGLLAGCGGDTTTVVEQTTTTVVDSSSTTDATSTTSAEGASTTTASTESSGGTGAAQSLKAFQSPTGNIACVMTPKFARCDIADRTWKPPPHPSSCPNEVDFGQGIQLPASGAAQFVCAGDTTLNPQAPKLEYGSSSQIGSITCTSAESGMSCSNSSGGSFTISRESYDLG